MKKRWILAVYSAQDEEKAQLYRTVFEEHGYGWETDLKEQTLLLADAVLFLCRDDLFDDNRISDAFAFCLHRQIPVILAEKGTVSYMPDYTEEAEVYDASVLSFDDLAELLKEEPVQSEPPVVRRHTNRLAVLFAVLAFLGALWMIVRISPSVMPAEPAVSEVNLSDQYGDAVVQVWSIGSFGDRVYRGSGFAVSRNGDILTNAHVVDHPSSRYCIVYMDHVYNAEVTAVSGQTDLALLKTDQPVSSVLHFRSAAPEKNTPVFVIGYPEDQGKTVTEGIYDGTAFISDTADYEVIRVSLRQGNSGSPVCTYDGSVIGVASAVSTADQETGLMIPAEDCMVFLKDHVFLEEQP